MLELKYCIARNGNAANAAMATPIVTGNASAAAANSKTAGVHWFPVINTYHKNLHCRGEQTGHVDGCEPVVGSGRSEP